MYVRSLCWTSFHCPAEKLEGDRIQWLLSRVTWLGQAPGAAHRVVILLDVTNPCTLAKAVHHQQGHSDSGHHNSHYVYSLPHQTAETFSNQGKEGIGALERAALWHAISQVMNLLRMRLRQA